MRYVKLVRYVKLAVYSHRHDRTQYGAKHFGGVYCVSQRTILHSVERNNSLNEVVMKQRGLCKDTVRFF